MKGGDCNGSWVVLCLMDGQLHCVECWVVVDWCGTKYWFEICWWVMGMASIDNFPIYFPYLFLIYFPIYFPIYFHVYFPIYFHVYFPIYFPIYVPIHVPISFPIYFPL